MQKNITDEEVFEFWSSHDTSDYIDLTKMIKVRFPNLKRKRENKCQ